MATLDGLHPTLMLPRVEALLADPDAQQRPTGRRWWGRVFINSGARTREHQERLWAGAIANCRANRAKCPPSKWVARPGTSNHEVKAASTLRGKGYTAAEVAGQDGGIAVDFGIEGVHANAAGQWPPDVDTWFQQLAARHGLEKRMPWEDWHYEPKRDWIPPEEDFDMDEDRLREIIREEVGSNGMKVVEAVTEAVTEAIDKPLVPLKQRGYSADEARPRSALARLYLDRFGRKKG